MLETMNAARGALCDMVASACKKEAVTLNATIDLMTGEQEVLLSLDSTMGLEIAWIQKSGFARFLKAVHDRIMWCLPESGRKITLAQVAWSTLYTTELEQK